MKKSHKISSEHGGSFQGRPASLKSEKMRQELIDAVLSLWANSGDEFSFADIHKYFVSKGLVSNKEYSYKTVRLLDYLKKIKLIAQQGKRGPYRLIGEPTEFKIFNYLQALRTSCESSDFQVGGSLWSLCQLYFLGMSPKVSEYVDAQYALEILNIRIAQLFEAVRVMSAKVNQISEQGTQNTNSKFLKLPSEVVREVILELIPFYLGCRAGTDGDGLPLEELELVIPEMAKSLPEEVSPQSPTLKRIILDNFLTMGKLIDQKNWDSVEDFESEFEYNDFALVVTRPEPLINSTGHEQRAIKEIIEHDSCLNALHIVSSLLRFNKNNVIFILNIFGRKLLGNHKFREVKALYDKLYASNRVGRIMDSYKFYDKKTKNEAKQTIEVLANAFGVKSIVKYLPFSRCSLNFVLPTPAKEQLLTQFFPQISEKKLHDWLKEGAAIASKIYAEKIDMLKKI